MQLDFSGASVCVFLELLPQQHELLQAESRLHRRGQRRVVTTYFLLSRCGPSAAAPSGVSSHKAGSASASTFRSVSGDLSETTAAEGEQEETDNTWAEEEELFLCTSSTNPLSCSRRSSQGRAGDMDREAEAVEEAAWHRIKHQSALVQRTIDGPLATLSQIGEAQQQQQEAQQQEQLQQQQEETGPSLCNSSQEQEDDMLEVGGGQLQHQHQQHQQQQQEVHTDEVFTTGLDLCSFDSLQGASQDIDLPTTPTEEGEGEGHPGAAMLSSLQGQPQLTVGLPTRLVDDRLALSISAAVRFRISRYTQRLHAFRGLAAVPLGISFSPAELGTATLSHSVVGQQQQQQDQHREGPQQHLLFQLRISQGQCPKGEALRCVQEAARQYLCLFRLLSSFEQRRVRETAWTVQNLQVYIHRRHRAQQQSSGKSDSFLGSDPPEEGNPGNGDTQEQQVTDVPASLMPRHTTDPLLLLQSAAATQQQEQQRLQRLFSCPEGEEIAPGEQSFGPSALDLSGSNNSDVGQGNSGSKERSSEADEDLLSGTVSSRLKRRSEVITTPQNFANDPKHHWLIRCCEQDLTCSGRCSDAYTARRRRQALRRQVERHDRGVCSNCRLDCGELLIALKMLHAAGEPQWRLEEEVVRLAPSFRAWPSLTRKLARHLTASCAWEADHRQPVKEGGGLATVDAVQTLCKYSDSMTVYGLTIAPEVLYLGAMRKLVMWRRLLKKEDDGGSAVSSKRPLKAALKPRMHPSTKDLVPIRTQRPSLLLYFFPIVACLRLPNLPTVATSQQQQPAQQPAPEVQQTGSACADGTKKLSDDKPAVGSVEQPKQQEVPESMRIQTPVPSPAVIEPASLPPQNAQVNCSPCGCEKATPRWQENESIFPTMHYLIKTRSREPINQSVLLVNPSKSDKTFNLRLYGDSKASLDKEAASIREAICTVASCTKSRPPFICQEKETENAYIDLVQGGNLYDKIRVETHLL
ncbi:LOW QUALITY PROTEIN: SNF2 super family, related [Eimeria mitis]|uniref:SNF2 super family, related n=1 Tax=Eimeria mitis TaxID=44415 RepID=U6KMU2_9EIME|nr:LOW QUALITY PROTEIN: SNF2 super family, related [Eimeria mitis]CDJ36773.1 SNF2 super family, related [Eimeria mitis]